MIDSRFNKLSSLENRWLDICSDGAISLAPDRKVPTCPAGILSTFEMIPSCKREMLAENFISLIDAMHFHFPENIYWDIDALIHSLLKFSLNENKTMTLNRLEKIIDLMKIFGKEGVIRFQYFHDFTYGFDWVKWFQKTSPLIVDESDPFANDFLSYMLKRGKELVVSIANNEQKYQKLAKGVYRNSYSFDRSPDSERKGMVLLRDRNAIPLKVWISETRISYRTDYLKSRESILTDGAFK